MTVELMTAFVSNYYSTEKLSFLQTWPSLEHDSILFITTLLCLMIFMSDYTTFIDLKKDAYFTELFNDDSGDYFHK